MPKVDKCQLLAYNEDYNLSISHQSMGRDKHPNKHIEGAIRYAESRGWTVKKPGKSSHSWGKLQCRENSRQGCQIYIYSTPKVPENHAQQIISFVDKCEHKESQYED